MSPVGIPWNQRHYSTGPTVLCPPAVHSFSQESRHYGATPTLSFSPAPPADAHTLLLLLPLLLQLLLLLLLLMLLLRC